MKYLRKFRLGAGVLTVLLASGCSDFLSRKPNTGYTVTYDAASLAPGREATEVRDQVRRILTARLASLGLRLAADDVTGPASFRFLVRTKDSTERALVEELLGMGGRLEFRLVAADNDTLVAAREKSQEDFVAPAGYEKRQMTATRDGHVHTDDLFVSTEAEPLGGADVVQATPVVTTIGSYAVNIRFSKRGAAAFADITGKAIGRRLAIIIDDNVCSAPMVRERIVGGSAEVAGSFTAQQALQLAAALNTKQLPVKVRVTSRSL